MIEELTPILESKIGRNACYLNGKIVFEEEDIIYRLSSVTDMQKRIGLSHYFSSKGCPILADETIIILSQLWCLTSQEKLKKFDKTKVRKIPPIRDIRIADYSREFYRFLETAIYEDYGEKAYQIAQSLFNQFDIIWPHEENVGIDKSGKIKIFDYVANVAATTEYLKDQNGNILCDFSKLNIRNPRLLPNLT